VLFWRFVADRDWEAAVRGAFLIGIAVLGVQIFAPVQARAADHLDCA